MHYILVFIGIVLIVTLAACIRQPESAALVPALQWSRTFGEGSNVSGGPVQQTRDGGYILCGAIEAPGKEGAWLIKTDADGKERWERLFDGGNVNSLQQTADGGYIMCGNIKSSKYGNSDIWLIKTDAQGNKIWDKTFGGKRDDGANSVQQTTDGGYILCGNTGSYGPTNMDIWLIKTDGNGNRLWDETFGEEDNDRGNSVQQTTDGGYILCGFSSSQEELQLGQGPWLIRTDANGNKLWDKRFKDMRGGRFDAVRQTADGGYVTSGANLVFIGEIEVLLVRTDVDGNKQWDKMFGGQGIAFSHSFQQTADGGYIMCGIRYKPEASGTSIWLIKTDAKGKKVWDKEFGDEAWCSGDTVQQTTDGGYIVSGSSSPEMEKAGTMVLLKFAPEQ
jgi:hypothetical protein